MIIPILFEDDAMVVINKPPGVVVNRAESVKEQTIQDWVEKEFRIQNVELRVEDEEFTSRSGIVHRIDKETSGILLIAKTPAAFFALKQQFMDRTIQKTYLAIIHGRMPAPDGEIKAPVGRLPWNRERFGVVPDGKEAVTLYKELSVFDHQEGKKKETLSLVEVYPKTGRTHQIRVHLKYSNHPIVGDYLYAGRKVSRDDRLWAPRVMLHATKVVFLHPTTQASMTIEAPMPEDMKAITTS